MEVTGARQDGQHGDWWFHKVRYEEREKVCWPCLVTVLLLAGPSLGVLEWHT